jgi:hypothetical protein
MLEFSAKMRVEDLHEVYGPAGDLTVQVGDSSHNFVIVAELMMDDIVGSTGLLLPELLERIQLALNLTRDLSLEDLRTVRLAHRSMKESEIIQAMGFPREE